MIVAKYADHCPLYRQAQIYARQGIDLDRSTLADWTGRGAWWLRPCMPGCWTDCALRPSCLPTRRRRPCSTPAAGAPRPASSGHTPATTDRGADRLRPLSSMSMRPDRKAERPITHLEGFRGVLQVDGYAGYRALAESGQVKLAFCLGACPPAISTSSPPGVVAPIATEALRADRRPLRHRGRDSRSVGETSAAPFDRHRARPIVEALKTWMGGEARCRLPKGQSRRGVPLRLVTLGGLVPLPR